MRHYRKIIAVALLAILLSSHFSPCFAALTITSSVINDWTAVGATATGDTQKYFFGRTRGEDYYAGGIVILFAILLVKGKRQCEML